MGVRIGSTATNTIANATITTTAETIAFTTGPMGLAFDNALVLVTWEVVVTLTAGTTAITPRLRRGSALTSTLVNVATAITVTASTTVKLSGHYLDLPGLAAGLQYSLTLQMTAAGANSTVNDGAMSAIVL